MDVLIGSNHYWDLATGNMCSSECGVSVATETRLGWVLSEPVQAMEDLHPSLSFLTTDALRVDADVERLEDVLKSVWNFELMRIVDSEDSDMDAFTQAIQFKNGHCEVALPRKDMHSLLPDNLERSKKRLEGLLYQLKQGPDIKKEYDSINWSQLQNGIVLSSSIYQLHYLPHHAVIRKDKESTNVRIVYDASAK